jgi:hypothetical protein
VEPVRLAPNRVQFAVWPDDARGAARPANEEPLRETLGADCALRPPENAFDLQELAAEADALGTEEPPREPKNEPPVEDGADARGADMPPRPPPPPPNQRPPPRGAPCAGASAASKPHVRTERTVRRSLMADLLA